MFILEIKTKIHIACILNIICSNSHNAVILMQNQPHEMPVYQSLARIWIIYILNVDEIPNLHGKIMNVK
jgi:hypothetical protein